MNSDQLLSKQGPLAHVWLAANYDKKLSKQQLLNTNIITSSKYISNQPLAVERRPASSGSQSQTVGTITLRLSGQLLLGIVRIYSRKTKYLLDDVNDTLYKLKNSFKIAQGGGALGNGSDAFNINAVNLPPQQTTISNMNNIMLRDQVADFDLLYQEDLNLDDDVPASSGADVARTLFSQVNDSVNNNEDSFNFDQSIEYPRYADDDMGADIGTNDDMGGDMDLELDFDLNDDENNNDDASDRSIEVGRNTSMSHLDNPEMSLLDINTKDDNFDLGNPLETIDQIDTAAADEPATPTDEQPVPEPVSRPRKAIVGITETGELRTNKRKLVVDAPEDLETGIPTSTLRTIQRLQISDDLTEVTVSLSDHQKMQLIQELSCPVAANNKRRKLWNIDDRLQQECLRLSRQEEEAERERQQQEELSWDQDNFGNDFDLSLPDLESDNDGENQDHDNSLPLEELPAQDDYDLQSEDFNNDNKTKASIQVAGHLRDAFNDKSVVQLSQVIEKDLSITNVEESKFPLGTKRKTDEAIKISKRREATTCFFELLVLATHDCISIDQASPADPTQIGGQIDIRSKDKLFSKFL